MNLEEEVCRVFGSLDETADALDEVLSLFIRQIDAEYDQQANKDAMIMLLDLAEVMRKVQSNNMTIE